MEGDFVRIPQNALLVRRGGKCSHSSARFRQPVGRCSPLRWHSDHVAAVTIFLRAETVTQQSLAILFAGRTSRPHLLRRLVRQLKNGSYEDSLGETQRAGSRGVSEMSRHQFPHEALIFDFGNEARRRGKQRFRRYAQNGKVLMGTRPDVSLAGGIAVASVMLFWGISLAALAWLIFRIAELM
jgi:hypothetical protein